MEHLPLRIDKNCFKIKDQRITRILSGQLPLEGFALSITANDPFVIIGNTIYALTEQEFYSLHAAMPSLEMSESVFKSIVDSEDLSYMSDSDRKFVLEVREKLPNCPACRYKKFKSEIYKLAKKYGLANMAKDMDTYTAPEYPETAGELEPVVPLLSPDMYKVDIPGRTECLDCVEKHVAQAYITACESRNGYPEYLALVIGHLSEALSELPKELTALRDTLEYCLARSGCYRKAFVPLFAIEPLIMLSRSFMRADTDTYSSSAGKFELDLSETAKNEIEQLSDAVFARVERYIRDIKTYEAADGGRMRWEGAMACLADEISSSAPALASVIRNRRILFTGAPSLMSSSGYGLADVLAVRTSRSL